MATERSPQRPQCSVYLAASVDGFIARPDGGLDWLEAVHREGEDYGYAEFVRSIDAHVVGRKTYDAVLGFGAWPYAGKRVVVLTRRPPAPRHGEEFYAGDPGALLERLAREGVRRAYVDGGDVVRQFLAARLVDDLTLSVIPLLLGQGVPLFGGALPEQGLTLEEARSYPSGLVRLRYRAGGPFPAA